MLQRVWKISLVGLFMASLVAAIHPEVRSQVRGTFLKDYRLVVSSTSSDFMNDGTKFNIVKIKTRNGLFVEVYAPQAGGGQKLLEKIELRDQNDGFFSFNGQATNLAVDDIDGDGRPEILAPSFDKNLVGHLNIYRFSPASKDFQKVIL